MDRSKKNLTAGPGNAPVKEQGHTKHARGHFGTNPSASSPWGNNKDGAVKIGESR